MLVLVLVGVVLLLVVAIELGYIPPLTASTLIQVRNGAVRVEKGRLNGNASEHLAAILRESGVSEGYIAITSGKRVFFSRLIPPEIHQRLRNVLLNQWR